VEQVSWDDIQTFLEKFNAKTEKNTGCRAKRNGNMPAARERSSNTAAATIWTL